MNIFLIVFAAYGAVILGAHIALAAGVGRNLAHERRMTDRRQARRHAPRWSSPCGMRKRVCRCSSNRWRRRAPPTHFSCSSTTDRAMPRRAILDDFCETSARARAGHPQSGGAVRPDRKAGGPGARIRAGERGRALLYRRRLQTRAHLDRGNDAPFRGPEGGGGARPRRASGRGEIPGAISGLRAAVVESVQFRLRRHRHADRLFWQQHGNPSPGRAGCRWFHEARLCRHRGRPSPRRRVPGGRLDRGCVRLGRRGDPHAAKDIMARVHQPAYALECRAGFSPPTS